MPRQHTAGLSDRGSIDFLLNNYSGSKTLNFVVVSPTAKYWLYMLWCSPCKFLRSENLHVLHL